MSGDIFTQDENNNAAVRTINVNSGESETNSPEIFTTDENGNAAVRVVVAGGGGDQHNLGWYATESALTTAHPTATDGDWAIVGSTDTVWVWDSDTSAWVDTDSKAQVTPDMIIVKSATMPSASTVPAGAVYQYVGTTSGSYTHGYIYENKETISYTDSVEFNPASISGTTVTATTGALASLCEEYGSGDITDIIKGTLTYDLAGGLLVFVGLDDTDTQVCTFQLYTQDYEDAGFTFTGTLADGDVINFTCTISAVSGYAWERIDVQPNSVNSVNGKTGAVVLTESDLLTVITISSATATQALADSTIYNCGAMTSLEITLPATVPAEFVSQFNFTSGTTPTSFTSPVGMKWLGDDCNGTAFVPVASKRYMVMVASDGVSVRGIVQAA